MVSEAILQEVTRRLVEKFHPVAIILFGSQARGTADDRSDVDLIVLCDSVTDRNALEAEMIAAMRGIPVPIDLLAYTPEEFRIESSMQGSVAHPAGHEGKVVYDRAA